MRILITGPSKSGKSLYAEKMLLKAGKELVYIGTLPNTYGYLNRIKIHKNRRDARWNTYEITQDWKYDVFQLQKIFNESRPILLDGLSVLMWRALNCSTSSDWHTRSQYFIEFFIELLNKSTCDWIIVDVNQPYPCSKETQQFNEASHFIHQQIITICGATKNSIR